MSATAAAITPARFAAALPALPLSSLHAKAAELRNAIEHLKDSNRQLQSFAEEGDTDCVEFIRENEDVIQRNEGRIEMLRHEVEQRGFRRDEGVKSINGEGARAENGNMDGDVNMSEAEEQEQGAGAMRDEINEVVRTRGGQLNDEELARRIRERIQEDEGDEDGVHL